MDKVFLTVLRMSLTGAFVIAGIILARLPLKKAPKIISYCLWAVAGFRLVFPFSIESALSLIPRQLSDFTAPMVTLGNAMSLPPNVSSQIDVMSPVQVEIVMHWQDYAARLWLIGAVVMLTYSVVSYIRLLRRIDNVTIPCVYGFIKPKIHIPTGLSDSEYSYVLLHEQTHIKRRDHLVKAFAYLVLCIHWFNPMAWAAFMLMGVDMEMSCDERVLKEMGSEMKYDYSRSLLSLATQRRVIGGTPLAFSEGGLKQRINNVLNFKKPPRVVVIAAVILAAVLSVGFAVNRNDYETAAAADIPQESTKSNTNSNSASAAQQLSVNTLINDNTLCAHNFVTKGFPQITQINTSTHTINPDNDFCKDPVDCHVIIYGTKHVQECTKCGAENIYFDDQFESHGVNH